MKKTILSLVLLLTFSQSMVLAPVAIADTSTTTSITVQAHLDLITSLQKQIHDLLAQITSLMASLKSEQKSLGQTVRQSGKSEDSDDTDEHSVSTSTSTSTCLTMPPGHLIAPGWNKKNAKSHSKENENSRGEKENIQRCLSLPHGIGKKIEFGWKWFNHGHGSTTPPVQGDTTAPIISSVGTSNLTPTSVSITWNTNESATSKVYVGTTSPLATSTAVALADASLVLNHSIQLTGLASNTIYYFIVESSDASGNKTSSVQYSLTTTVLDVTGPIISGVSVTPLSTTTSIAWNTNESATSKVYYGTTTPLSLVSALNVSNASLITSHNVSVSGLATSTTYYFVIESRDALNNTSTTTESNFTTLP